MSENTTGQIQQRLFQVVAELPLTQQEQVLNFALSLNQQELTQRWQSISDEEAAAIKAEFADEDLEISEAVLTDYLVLLQNEDDA